MIWAPGGINTSLNLWYANPPATFQSGRRESKMDWESADLELAAAVSPRGHATPDTSSVLSGPQHQRSPGSGSFSLSSADIMCWGTQLPEGNSLQRPATQVSENAAREGPLLPSGGLVCTSTVR